MDRGAGKGSAICRGLQKGHVDAWDHMGDGCAITAAVALDRGVGMVHSYATINPMDG